MPPFAHTCGYPLIRVLPRSVHSSALLVWHDGNPKSPTHRQPLTHCPGCGQDLSEHPPRLPDPPKR
jgi:hypothetical protein